MVCCIGEIVEFMVVVMVMVTAWPAVGVARWSKRLLVSVDHRVWTGLVTRVGPRTRARCGLGR